MGSRNEIYQTIHELPMLPIESRGGHFTCGLLLAILYNKDLNHYACIPVHLVGHQTASYVEGIAFLTSTEGCACVRSAASLVPSHFCRSGAGNETSLLLASRQSCLLPSAAARGLHAPSASR